MYYIIGREKDSSVLRVCAVHYALSIGDHYGLSILWSYTVRNLNSIVDEDGVFREASFLALSCFYELSEDRLLFYMDFVELFD